MPRPFAVIGITVFLVLMVLSGVSSKLVLIAGAVFTAALLACLMLKRLRGQTVFPVAFASAAVACILLLCVNEFYYYPLLKIAGNTYHADVLITDECEKKYGNCYYKGRVVSADGEKIRANVTLCFSSGLEAKPYDTVSGNFVFYKLGRTDAESAVSRKAENRFLGAYPADKDIEIKTGDSFHIGRFFVSARTGVKKTLLRLLPNDYGGLCVAMLTGDRSALSDSGYTALRKCGISHIICVSGLHLSLWTSAVLYLLRRLKLGEKASCLIAVPSVLFLMLFMGMTYSVIRSGIMMLIYLISVILSQRRDSLNSLGIALTVISVMNPFSPGHLSLKLSALSTMGIITAGEYVFPALDTFLKKHSALKAFKGLIYSVPVTFAAVLFTLPVTFPMTRGFNFGVFPANFLTVLLAEVCMVCAAAGVVIGLVSINIINIPAFAAGFCAKGILGLSSKISRIDFLQFNIGEKDTYIILCFMFAFCAAAVLIAPTVKKRIFSSACLLCGIFVFSLTLYSYVDSRCTRATVFDTGSGSAVLISRDSENILIGCGGDSYNGAYEISEGILSSGGSLDVLILPDMSDKYSAYLPDTANSFLPGKVYCNNADYTAELALKNTEILPDDGEIHSGSSVINSYTDNRGKKFYVFRNPDLSLLMIPEANTDISGFYEETKDCDILVINMDYPEGAEFSSLKAAVIQASSPRGETLERELSQKGINAFAVSSCGSTEITARGGKVSIRKGK